MSRLEKFIEENRDEFDDGTPSEKVWQKVESALGDQTGKNFRLHLFVKWSAAAAVLLLIFAGVYSLTGKKNPGETVIVQNADSLIANDTETAREEYPEMNHFAKIIALKQEELKLLATEQPELYQKFAKDINQLDSSYNTLKNQLSITPNRELLIAAMIQNLQLQLNVLNQQLNIIHQIKNLKKHSHEKIKSFT